MYIKTFTSSFLDAINSTTIAIVAILAAQKRKKV